MPEFIYTYDKVTQATTGYDQVFGIPGFHEIRPKIEPLQNDYLDMLGRNAVRRV